MSLSVTAIIHDIEAEAGQLIHPVKTAVTKALNAAEQVYNDEVQAIAADVRSGYTAAVASLKAAAPALTDDALAAAQKLFEATLAAHGL